MDRARRIWHRGWLRRAITVFSFGYFPVSDSTATYIVTADVECRFVAIAEVAATVIANASSEIRFVAIAEVAATVIADASSEIRFVAIAEVGL